MDILSHGFELVRGNGGQAPANDHGIRTVFQGPTDAPATLGRGGACDAAGVDDHQIRGLGDIDEAEPQRREKSANLLSYWLTLQPSVNIEKLFSIWYNLRLLRAVYKTRGYYADRLAGGSSWQQHRMRFGRLTWATIPSRPSISWWPEMWFRSSASIIFRTARFSRSAVSVRPRRRNSSPLHCGSSCSAMRWITTL